MPVTSAQRRVIIISPVPIFPTHGGNRARIVTFIDALREDGYDVHFVLLDSRQIGDCDLAGHEGYFGAGFTFLRRSFAGNAMYLAGRAIGKFRRRLSRSRKHRLSSVDEIFYPPFLRGIRRIAAATRFDIAIAQYAYFSGALDVFPATVLKMIDTHDSFAHEISGDEERKAFMRADVVIAIQDVEAEAFRALLGAEAGRVRVISHIIADEPALDLSHTAGASFIGSSFLANIKSLRYFVSEILPLILHQMPEFRLFVAGSICKEIDDHPAITKLGRVPAIADAFKAAPISLNPIVAGTGVKIKLLESMSLGLPTVSTRRGTSGIAEEYLDGVVTVDDDRPDLFADAVVALCRDAERRRHLGEAAYATSARWNADQKASLRAACAAPLRVGKIGL